MLSETGEQFLWVLRSELGQEKLVMNGIEQLLKQRMGKETMPLLDEARIQDIRTAVSEACLNAFEHANQFNGTRKVEVVMTADLNRIVFRVRDGGDGWLGEDGTACIPTNLDDGSKLEAENPRGWGLFLMQELSDEIWIGREAGKHVVKLTFNSMHG